MGSTEIDFKDMPLEIVYTKMKNYIMPFPEKTRLVRISDACLKRKDLQCLFKENGWLNGDVSWQCPHIVKPMCVKWYNVLLDILQVITAYIYYLRTQEHLQNRAGGKVWLDTTHVSAILKRDGEIPISPEDHVYIVRRALIYLEHDMVIAHT